MFKSSAVKFFFGLLAILASSCSLWRSNETAAPSPTPFTASEIVTEIPFSTEEPEIYQTEIVITTDGTERKIFTARNKARRITIFNRGETGEIERLETDNNFVTIINRARKVYAGGSADATAAGENSNDFLTTEWLNQKTPAAFENLGSENGLSKFRVKLGDGENLNSEVLIFVDENLKLPVRQEFYSASGEQKTLTFSVELKNFKPEAPEDFFQIPKDLRFVSTKEFQEIIRQESDRK